MKCLIPGANIKVFGKAIHSLSKIGDELYFEPLENELAVRTVNSSRSAYACFLFSTSFFFQFDSGIRETSEGEEDDVFKCKVGTKSCLSIFKSLATLEKTVDRCSVELDVKHSSLVFKLYCKHGIVKTYNISFIECETLQAVFSKDTCVNQLTSQTRLLSDIVANFQANQEEVTVIIDKEKTRFKNYVDDEPDVNKVIHTEMALDPDEFDVYQVENSTQLTFCLKELRAILSFADNIALTMYFNGSGQPIVLGMDSDPSFEANFVLATLAEKPDKNNTQLSSTTQHITNIKTPVSRRCADEQKQAPKSSMDDDEEDDDLMEVINRQMDIAESQHASQRVENAPQETSSIFGKGRSEVRIQNNNTVNNMKKNPSNGGDRNHERNGFGFDGLEDGASPVIPYPSFNLESKDAKYKPESNKLISSDSDDDDEIPGTPPSKRFRSMFSGFSQSTTASTQRTQVNAPRESSVFVEDTDEED